MQTLPTFTESAGHLSVPARAEVPVASTAMPMTIRVVRMMTSGATLGGACTRVLLGARFTGQASADDSTSLSAAPGRSFSASARTSSLPGTARDVSEVAEVEGDVDVRPSGRAAGVDVARMPFGIGRRAGDAVRRITVRVADADVERRPLVLDPRRRVAAPARDAAVALPANALRRRQHVAVPRRRRVPRVTVPLELVAERDRYPGR